MLPRAAAGGFRREGDLHLGRRKCARHGMRYPDTAVCRRRGRGKLSGFAGGLGHALPGAAGDDGRCRCHTPRRRDCRILQPLRHRGGVLPGGTGRRNPGGLFRSGPGRPRVPGCRYGRRHIVRRADGDRRARADEAVFPWPALPHGPAGETPGDGGPERRLYRRRDLRSRTHGPGRRNLARRRACRRNGERRGKPRRRPSTKRVWKSVPPSATQSFLRLQIARSPPSTRSVRHSGTTPAVW